LGSHRRGRPIQRLREIKSDTATKKGAFAMVPKGPLKLEPTGERGKGRYETGRPVFFSAKNESNLARGQLGGEKGPTEGRTGFEGNQMTL